jgi:hypothetical protein
MFGTTLRNLAHVGRVGHLDGPTETHSARAKSAVRGDEASTHLTPAGGATTGEIALKIVRLQNAEACRVPHSKRHQLPARSRAQPLPLRTSWGILWFLLAEGMPRYTLYERIENAAMLTMIEGSDTAPRFIV